MSSAEGEYARALAEIDPALGIAEEIDHRQWMCASHYTLAEIYRELFARDERTGNTSTRRSAGARARLGQLDDVITGSLASMLLSSGDTQAAAALLESSARMTTPPATMGQRQVRLAAAELALCPG